MNRTLKIIGDIISEPNAAFRVLKNHPNWGTVCVIIALVSIGIAWAVLPFSKQISHTKMLESGLNAGSNRTSQNNDRGLELCNAPPCAVPITH